jgi:hypothetical protein
MSPSVYTIMYTKFNVRVAAGVARIGATGGNGSAQTIKYYSRVAAAALGARPEMWTGYSYR